MAGKIGLILLAAGKGQRMGLDTPKPLVDIMGRKLIDYPLRACEGFLKVLGKSGYIGVVVGHASDVVAQHVESLGLGVPLLFIHQREQRGTAHALKVYAESPEFKEVETVIVACADTPLIGSAHMGKLFKFLEKSGQDAVAASFTMEDPKGHGRIVRGAGPGFCIVEEGEASSKEKTIKEVNSGLYAFKQSFLAKYLPRIANKNKSGEYYLTDIFRQELPVEAVHFFGNSIFKGVNTMEELHDVGCALRLRKLSSLMEKGVRILDKNSTFIHEDVLIGRGSTVGPHCVIEGKTVIGEGSTIKPGSCIIDSTLGQGVSVGPYAHLRSGSNVGDNCRIGNFVEVKQSFLAQGVKVSHLSYVGDATIGEETNIGCGFITCNYDGQEKHRSIIGRQSFIGSDTQLIAPVKIGDRCFVASGSTINQDMEDGDFAIARSRQVTKKGGSKRFLKGN